ncbi:tRNA (mo5U34)-methyltransferase [Planctomycetes bacterium CA13]|uniref:tRNA (Mo5U34)-methyltransferase n=1 Tax=Novipirellula herctigrandis TaxID=2527986 RepID=A0A5C5YY16_9BACT|nr:tRNA (mo5U34)-methyltransferase [Planctomycetes bacterium CA13]
MTLFDRQSFYDWLSEQGQTEWASQLRAICNARFFPPKHGNLDKWKRAYGRLPEMDGASVDGHDDAVAVKGELAPATIDSLRETLMQFHPWRKGPFSVCGIEIDTEWRSNLKWQRVLSAIDLRNKAVLDVGCGNGYYGWKMLAAGADCVVGCDPYLLYVMQFEAIRRYAEASERHWIVPLADTELPAKLNLFDVAFSMGVLYHRTSPIDHLQTIAETLRPGGQVVLETLIVETDDFATLVPVDRYAKMRNVWFIPSTAMLSRWMSRTGFKNIRVVDITTTTSNEQRKTDWMTFESLSDFLDPSDPTKTIEGYPCPVRAIVVADRK